MLERTTDLLSRLRTIDVGRSIGASGAPTHDDLVAQWDASGIRFASSSPEVETQYYRAVRELLGAIRPAAGSLPILNEGGIYHGCWIESTGTISAELLCRFLPAVAARTFVSFAEHQRSDGLFPYKLTTGGPGFAQIQIVTPFARSVWNGFRLGAVSRDELATLYAAMARNDAWLAAHRDTRGTGAVEAFCTYDTGHDRSARFWHIPDSPLGNDPARYNAGNPFLPLIAPDLTANVACQRSYLALIAEELGEDGESWRTKAEASEAALHAQCFDMADGFFYDRARDGSFVRVQSDVLLRVLASEIGDDSFFANSLRRYLLNTRKFFARFPFTSLALDDPRFDPNFDHNSWSGPTNLLSIIRAPHAFEAHGRYVELTWLLYPIVSAQLRAERFAQTLNPWTGDAGFTETYSPSTLCLIDFIERLSGILPRPDGTLWFTGLVPQQIEHRDVQHETAYSRTVDGIGFELVNTTERSIAYRDDALLFDAPRGLRIVTDRAGAVRAAIGMSVVPVEGTLQIGEVAHAIVIAANQQFELIDGQFKCTSDPGLVLPTT